MTVIQVIPGGFGDFLSDIISGLAHFSTLMANVRFFVPLNTIMMCTTIFIAVYGAEFFISLLNWILRKIPTIG